MFFELVLEVGEVAISGHRGQAAEGVLRSFWRREKKNCGCCNCLMQLKKMVGQIERVECGAFISEFFRK